MSHQLLVLERILEQSVIKGISKDLADMNNMMKRGLKPGVPQRRPLMSSSKRRLGPPHPTIKVRPAVQPPICESDHAVGAWVACPSR